MMRYKNGFNIYNNHFRGIIAAFLVCVMIVSTTITSDFITSKADKAPIEGNSENAGMFSYDGAPSLYAGESITLTLLSGRGSDVVWYCDDPGNYTSIRTSADNNQGDTFYMDVIGGTSEGADVTITAINESTHQYKSITLKVLANNMFWFTQGPDHTRITTGSVDLPYNGSIVIGTNQLKDISFTNTTGYVYYEGSGSAGYTVSNQESDTTTNPENPVSCSSQYSFTDNDGYAHNITIKLNIHVIDTISLSQQSDITVYKGSENGPSTFDVIATVTNLTENISWKVYSGDLTADACLALETADPTRVNPEGITLKTSTTKANSSVNRQLNDMASVSIDKDLDLTVYDTYTILVSQLIYGERSINAICHVHVLQPATGLTLSQHTANLFLGGNNEPANSRITITATLVGDNGLEPNDTTIIWQSTDNSIVDITSNGTACTLNAKLPGSCVVVATSKQNPSATDVIYVTVSPKVSSVDITAKDMTVNLAEQYIQLFANVQSNAVDETVDTADYDAYASALNKNVVWSSNDKSVATVDMYTGKVTLLSAGKVTITCSSADDTKISDSIIITINVPVAQIFLQDNYKKISVGESFTLYYQLISNYAGYEPSNKEVTWESSDDQVAVVDNDGKVTGVSGGTATILCRADEGQITATCTVEVYQAVSRIDLSATSMELNVGQEAVLEAFVYPTTASQQTVSWESNKPEIVSVTEDGVVSANQLGAPVVITAYIVDKDRTVKATCIVTVVVPLTSITVSPATNNLKKGDTVYLTTTVTPDNASTKSVVYGSTDSSVAVVDANGLVTAVGGGDCYITARSKGNRDMMTSSYIVVDESVEGMTLNKYTKTLSKGSQFLLVAKIKNKTATNKDIYWSSTDDSIATVNQNGVVTAKGYGSCYVTAHTMDGSNLTRSCKIIVRRYVSSIKLKPSKLYIKVKTKATIKATVSPSNASVKTLKWTSSNSKIASVTNKGVVTGKKIGNCKITCKATDGSGVKKTIKVYVKKSLTRDMITANRIS